MKAHIKKLRLLALTLLLLGSAQPLFAQPPGHVDDTSDAPIDGGITLLAAAGVGYGVKKYRDMRKKGTEEGGDVN